MVVPTYIDAIVPGVNRYNNCLYFFKVFTFLIYKFIALFLKLPIERRICLL